MTTKSVTAAFSVRHSEYIQGSSKPYQLKNEQTDLTPGMWTILISLIGLSFGTGWNKRSRILWTEKGQYNKRETCLQPTV